MESFAALHCHSMYSFSDGIGSIEEWVKTAKAKGLAGLAITDHGDVSSMLELYECGKKHNFPVILGCELYISMDGNKDKDDRYCHLVAWVKNAEGYKNLCRLSYLSYQEDHFYYKPRVFWDDLVKHKEGLIIGSGCIVSPVAKYFDPSKGMMDDDQKAFTNFKKFHEEFGEDFYLEIQAGKTDHKWNSDTKDFECSCDIDKQTLTNTLYRCYSREFGVKILATPDAHMPDKEQKTVQDIQLCNLYKDGMKYYETYFLPTRQEFLDWFNINHGEYLRPDELGVYLDNTYEVLEKCKDLKLEFNYNLPDTDKSSMDIWKVIEEKGIVDINDPIYYARLKEELSVICDNGKINLLPYFLVLEDIIEWCSKNDVFVGPGRGSAAGSLLNFALGITKIDPIKYNLSFNRFLNLARVKKGTLPDIDIDFSDPQKVKAYLVSKYGQDHVFPISTNQTLKVRSALKDAIRVLAPDIEAEQANALTHGVNYGIDDNQIEVLKDAINKNIALKQFFRDNKGILKAVYKLIGQVRQRGIHAAAVVMSKDPVYDVVPVAKNKAEGEFITQYTMEWCEKAGLIKYDILGLNTLSDISGAIKRIKDRTGEQVDIYNIDRSDRKVFREFELCNTDTVFQFNTELVKGILSKVKVNSIEDLSIITSIARPGPMDVGMHENFISRSRGREDITYPHPILQNDLQNTYGIMVYQEQVMNAVKMLGGSSDSEADDIRKAMGKQVIELLDKAKDKFINYATKTHSISNMVANKLWDLIYSFGRYGFCHAHAVSYSLIAYICMWLKTYYPMEWWSSVLSNESDTDKVKQYYAASKETFILPDINKSKKDYVIDGEKIVMPLSLLTRIGEKAVDEIIKHQPYSSFKEFLDKVDKRKINKAVVLSLIWADVFKGLESKESKELVRQFYYDLTLSKPKGEVAKLLKEYTEETEYLNRFDIIKKKAESCPIFEADYQKQFHDYLSKDIISFETIDSSPDKMQVSTAGVIIKVKQITTKKQQEMAFAELSNNNKVISLTLFPTIYTKYLDNLKENVLVEVKGELDTFNGRRGLKVNSMRSINIDEQFN